MGWAFAASIAATFAARLRRRSVGLRALLTAIPVLVLLPLLAYAAAIPLMNAERHEREAIRDLEQSDIALAIAIEHEIGGAIRMLQVLAEEPLLGAAPNDRARFNATVGSVTGSRWGLISVALIDREGREPMLADWRQRPIQVLGPHHQQAFDQARPVVSSLHPSRFDGRLSVSLSVPVIRNAEVPWLLTARLDPEHLRDLLTTRLGQLDRIAVLSDVNGRVIARSTNMERFFGMQLGPEMTDALETAVQGTRDLPALDGRSLLWSWRTLPFGWTVALGQPTDAYRAPLRASMQRLGAAALLALALGIVLATAIAQRLSSAVDTMATSAQHLLDGVMPPRRRSGIRQLDALDRSLHSAARRLRSARQQRDRALQAGRRARTEAEEANRAKDAFLAMLSHELRGPLAPITNSLRFIQRSAHLDEAGRSALSMANRQTAQLARLVDDLLETARIAQGKVTLRCAPLVVADAVRMSMQALSATAAAQGQRLIAQVRPDSGELLADEVRIAQVLNNLIGNAIKYTPRGGQIEVEARADGDGVLIRVSDNGAGIDAADLERIFQPFAQLNVTLDRSQGGLGIGLAWVRAIVALHGGRVWAESAGKGRGSRFSVRLPRRPTPPRPAIANAAATGQFGAAVANASSLSPPGADDAADR